jgi:hypothetical protein
LELGGSSGLDDVTTWFARHRQPAATLRDRVRKQRYARAGVPSREPPVKRTCIELIRRVPLPSLWKLVLLLMTEALFENARYKTVAGLALDAGAHRVTVTQEMQKMRARGLLGRGMPQAVSDLQWELVAAMCPVVSELRVAGRGLPGLQ